MRTKLTDRFIANVQPPKKGRLEFNDALEPGHVFSVTEHDHRAFSVRVWTGPKDKRKQRRVLLGHPRAIDGGPVLTLAQARQAARDVKQCAAEGKALRPGVGLMGAQTWGEISEAYLTAIEVNRRPKTVGEAKRRLRRSDFAEWRDRPAIKITGDDVRALRDSVAKRGPIEARHFVNLVNAVGTWAVEEKLLPASPAAGVKPGPRAAERERVLSDSEIGVFWRACDRLGYPYGPIAKLLLLTATRLREAGQLPWSELNLPFRVWALPAPRTKPKRALTHHLSAPAAAFLCEIAEQRAKVPALAASPYVFVGANGGMIRGFSQMKVLLDAAMEEETGEPTAPFQLRDLRRTAATVMARLKVSPVVVEKILNHAKGEALGGPVARIYNRFDFADDCAQALDKLGEFLTSLAKPRVVPLPGMKEMFGSCCGWGCGRCRECGR
jgi:integrase